MLGPQNLWENKIKNRCIYISKEREHLTVADHEDVPRVARKCTECNSQRIKADLIDSLFGIATSNNWTVYSCQKMGANS